MRISLAIAAQSVVVALLAATPLHGQGAEISGLISDPSGLAVPNTKVTVKGQAMGVTREVKSNQEGLYSVPALSPGSYDLTVEASGFKSIHQNAIVLEVDQRARLDFLLSIGPTSESVTVEGSAPILNSSDASVSTVIGNRFVANLPLNGRSFSSLIQLAPGVVLAPSNSFEQGQFSVNGQRPDANYFMVDGVSANVGPAGNGNRTGQSGAGELPATNALGGMSNLVSLDALEEFRIQTSTFAPEYGRTPGAQISVVTKSGTNDYHGTAFEYFRNDKLDANDWFANRNALARPELRQNDFGGVLGGPIRKNKLFFFGSYERISVRQPHIANTYVPSLASRQSAPAAVQPLLNAFPLPTGPNFANGTAAFAAGYSDPSSLDSGSVRIDYLPWQRVTIFGRYSIAPSELVVRAPTAYAYNTSEWYKYRTQTATLGSNQTLTPGFISELRLNYSRSRSHSTFSIDNFGGGTPPPDSLLFPAGHSAGDSRFTFFADSAPYGIRWLTGSFADNVTEQINVAENVSLTAGTHQFKFGLDYRRLHSTAAFNAATWTYGFLSLANVLTNSVPQGVVSAYTPNTQLVISNWSLFAQDTWKPARKLTITYGLRWEYNGAPSSPNGTLPFTVIGVENLRTMTLAPQGTPLWEATKDNFAPRLGVAWLAAPNLVVRAGGGIFYDLGYSEAASGISTWPYQQQKVILNTSFPMSTASLAPPPFSTALPAGYMVVMDPNHALPRTYEWNAAVERSLGGADSMALTYLGAAARKLMRRDDYIPPNPNFPNEFDVMRNGASSSYQALQAQFRRRFARGLQALISYTWAHSIDDVSSGTNVINVPPGFTNLSNRGSSDYDIRQTFSGAISYNIPSPPQGVAKAIAGNWSADSIFYVRTAPPVNVTTGTNPFPLAHSGANSVQRPDIVLGTPVWITDPNVADGKRINPAAFSKPVGTLQGNLGRNALTGFGASQMDLSLRRQFRLKERLSLQARADLFNLLNHPNFGPPVNYLSSPLFGQATQMLGSSMGAGGDSGGLNPLYQIGGPRSAQLALKLVF